MLDSAAVKERNTAYNYMINVEKKNNSLSTKMMK